MHAVVAIQRSGASLFLTSGDGTRVQLPDGVLLGVLDSLKQIGDVNSVDLAGTKANNADMAVLSQLPELQELDLHETAVTDAGLTQIARMPRLRSLNLRGNRISDNGLRWLTNLANLDELDLRDTLVTAHGVAELRRYLPEANIRW